MDKFNLELDESVLKKGPLKRYVGKAGLINAFTGKFKAANCKGVLTSKRFVAVWRVNIGPPFGPLVWLISWTFKHKKIIFSVLLDEIAMVKQEGPGGVITIKTVAGAEFEITTDAKFSVQHAQQNNQKWVQALIDAISAACPGKRVHRADKTVEFVKA